MLRDHNGTAGHSCGCVPTALAHKAREASRKIYRRYFHALIFMSMLCARPALHTSSDIEVASLMSARATHFVKQGAAVRCVNKQVSHTFLL